MVCYIFPFKRSNLLAIFVFLKPNFRLVLGLQEKKVVTILFSEQRTPFHFRLNEPPFHFRINELHSIFRLTNLISFSDQRTPFYFRINEPHFIFGLTKPILFSD